MSGSADGCEFVQGSSGHRLAKLRQWVAREVDAPATRAMLAAILAKPAGALVPARVARRLSASRPAGALGVVWARNASVVSRIIAEVQSWRFVSDPPGASDMFCPIAVTARDGGDCDDKAKAVVVLAMTAGIPADFRWQYQRDYDLDHVTALVELAPGCWAWAETTIAADLGESPQRAARRLGIIGGNDGLGTADAR